MAARSTVSAASAAPPRFWLRPESAGAHSRSGGRAVLPACAGTAHAGAYRADPDGVIRPAGHCAELRRQSARGRRAARGDARPDGRRGLRLRRWHARGLHGRAARRPGALGALLPVHGPRRAERAHHRHVRLGLSRRRPGAPRGACPDGGRPARRRPGGGLSPRAVSLRLAAGARALRPARDV